MSNNPITFTSTDYTVEKDGGTVTVSLSDAESVYAAHRPDTFTADQEKAVDKYRQQFVAAVIEGAIDTTANAFTRDKAVESVHILASPSNMFQVDATTVRQRVGHNPRTQEPVTTFGPTSVRVTTGYRRVGVIKKACTAMSERIKSELC